MNVLLTRRVPSAVLARLEAAHTVELYNGPSPIPEDELKRRVAGKQALICLLTERVSADVIASPGLKIVANIAVGFDNIDLPAARDHGVIVTNTPDVLTESVAEFTWTLILAAARRLNEGERLLRRGEWRGWALDFMLGTGLRGKQLGIIGAGRIGQAVAAGAKAFGMTTMITRRGQSIDQLLVSSDVVSLHVPGGAATHHLIDRKALARMKRSAILVNTSRGSVVDEEALGWALKERLIAAAALDVYEREPAVHPSLLGHENVILAPHLGSATRETRTAMASLAVENVLAVLDGRPAVTPI